MSVEKDQALAGLRTLIETCKSSLVILSTLSRSISSSTQPAPVQVLRNDMLSLQRLIHASTTRLSIALGKPPPSYPIALPPLNDLTKHVAQLSSCVSALPPGALRKEAVWAAEELLQALETLVQYFESRCSRDEKFGDEYLARTGAVHDAVVKAEKISRDESEAVAKAWRVNGESLEDSLKEIKEMMDESDDASEDDALEDDGWDELGEGFGGKLKPEEMERVKKMYPLLRLTTLLHGRILSHYILKTPVSGSHAGSHLLDLLQLSDAFLPASDDLVSALYAPQDLESIQEAAETVHKITKQFDRALASENSDEEAARQALERLEVQDSNKAGSDVGAKTRKWFQQCFSQIDIIHSSLNLEQPS